MAPIDDHGGWRAVLGRLTAGEDLTPGQARDALATILAGEATPAQTAAFIVALRMKGETVDEIVGMVDAMLEAAAPLELPPGTIDIVGTGGTPFRRRHSLNVSTMASVVAAAAGARVCKHGNVRASATSGSFDLLAELGVVVDLPGPALAACVAEVGLGFCFARAYHPAMRHAGPVRSEIGVPTVFNILGPLSHPGRVTRMVLGVGDPRLAPTVAAVLARRGVDRAWVVHGHGGMDEVSTTGPTDVWEVVGGGIEHHRIVPSEAGIDVVDEAAIGGGSPADNARILRDILAGAAGPRTDIVVLNAAAALVVAGVAGDLPSGVQAARAAIAEGRAATTLERVVAASRRLAP